MSQSNAALDPVNAFIPPRLHLPSAVNLPETSTPSPPNPPRLKPNSSCFRLWPWACSRLVPRALSWTSRFERDIGAIKACSALLFSRPPPRPARPASTSSLLRPPHTALHTVIARPLGPRPGPRPLILHLMTDEWPFILGTDHCMYPCEPPSFDLPECGSSTVSPLAGGHLPSATVSLPAPRPARAVAGRAQHNSASSFSSNNPPLHGGLHRLFNASQSKNIASTRDAVPSYPD
ncbi:hypothetical protein CC78DRAFT_580580 [Lojkania enalia]|uniref:Uncharacterized protein n=1 Tax=Lojkania enalia TaxID=147567 RepID=A0A9P4K8Z6_9PLEO|nr:hypothetical protein CC78DRAFT_580580 [Didymosphaeria enalia]